MCCFLLLFLYFWLSKVWKYLAPGLFCIWLFLGFLFGLRFYQAKISISLSIVHFQKCIFCTRILLLSSTAHCFMLRIKNAELSALFRNCFRPCPGNFSIAHSDLGTVQMKSASFPLLLSNCSDYLLHESKIFKVSELTILHETFFKEKAGKKCCTANRDNYYSCVPCCPPTCPPLYCQRMWSTREIRAKRTWIKTQKREQDNWKWKVSKREEARGEQKEH